MLRSTLSRSARGARAAAAVVAAGLAAACADATAPDAAAADFDLTSAFASLPEGYASVPTSFAGDAAAAGATPAGGPAAPWMAGGRGRGPGRDGLMGGGLGDAFAGGIAFGRGGHRGPFGGGVECENGVFDAATGRVVCATRTLGNGLTVTRSAAYQTAAGQVQQAFDTLTTDRVNVRVAVTGSYSFDGANGRGRGAFGFGGQGDGRGRGRGRGRGGDDRQRGGLLGDTATILSATVTVQNASERTASGLAQGSARRTVDGASASSETVRGTSSRGEFTATRQAGDTTTGLVVPVAAAGAASYPTAGTVVRSMRATLAYAGATPAVAERREVLTYDGSATARLVITENGTTRTCTVALPRGRPVCQ
jgi:hypothetical protein